MNDRRTDKRSSAPSKVKTTATDGSSARRSSAFDLKATLLEAAFVGIIVLCGAFLPWWGIVFPAFLRGLFDRATPHVARWSGVSTGVAWLLAAIYQDAVAGGRISGRLGALFQLPVGALIHLLLFVIAFAIGALAALTGHQLRALVSSLRERQAA